MTYFVIQFNIMNHHKWQPSTILGCLTAHFYKLVKVPKSLKMSHLGVVSCQKDTNMLCPPVPTLVEEHNTVRMDPEVEQRPLMASVKYVFSLQFHNKFCLKSSRAGPRGLLVFTAHARLVLISIAIIARHNTLPLFIF